MVAPSISDPFFKQLYARLADELDSRVDALARGSALIPTSGLGLDAITTALKYQEAVSYIAALQAVMELGLQFDKERYGRRPTNGDD